jgi:serine/threonine-protein phosphatase 6 regulatory ankyrin repeat subunit B
VLLENGADVNAQDRNGETTLLYAAKLGLTKMTQMLLDHGADANIGDTRGNVALHFVCGTESLESFETLMRNDADLNVLNYEGYTPIMSAIKSLKPSYGTPLPSHARDMNGMHGDGHTSFHHAKSWSSFGDTSILGVLLQHGADPNLRGSNIGPLLTAVVRNSAHALEDVQMLLRYGADVNASDNFGTTALHAAIMRQRIDIIDTLLQHNADVNVCVEQHTTPLMLAISLQASTEVVEILLKHGADVNFVTWWNVTALRTAVELGNVEVTRMLLDYGADVHSQEGWGKGIVNIAYGDSSEIITRLSSNFADVPPRLRSETASALEHQDWLKDYLRRNKVR